MNSKMKNCEYNSFFFLNFIKIEETLLPSSLLKRINEELFSDNQITERNVEAFHLYFSKLSLFHIKYRMKYVQMKEKNNNKTFQDSLLKQSVIFLCLLMQFRNNKKFETNFKYKINEKVRKIRKVYAFIDDFITKLIKVMYNTLSISNFKKIVKLFLLLSKDNETSTNKENLYSFKIFLQTIYNIYIHDRIDTTKDEIDFIKENLHYILEKLLKVTEEPYNPICRMYNPNIFLLSKYPSYSRILFSYSELIKVIKDEKGRKEYKDLLIKILLTIYNDSFHFNTVIHPLVDIMLNITNNMDSDEIAENKEDLIHSSFPINLIERYLKEKESHTELQSAILFNSHKDIPKISVEELSKDFIINAPYDIFFSFHFIPKENQIYYPIFTLKKGELPYISIEIMVEKDVNNNTSYNLKMNKTELLKVLSPNQTLFVILKETKKSGNLSHFNIRSTEPPIIPNIQVTVPIPNKSDEEKFTLTYGYDGESTFNGLLGSLVITKQVLKELDINKLKLGKYYEEYLFVNYNEGANPKHDKIPKQIEKVYCIIHPKMFQFVKFNDNVDDNLRINDNCLTEIRNKINTFTSIFPTEEELQKKKSIPLHVTVNGFFNKYCHIVIEDKNINNFINADGLNTLIFLAEYQFQMAYRIIEREKESKDEMIAQM